MLRPRVDEVRYLTADLGGGHVGTSVTFGGERGPFHDLPRAENMPGPQSEEPTFHSSARLFTQCTLSLGYADLGTWEAESML